MIRDLAIFCKIRNNHNCDINDKIGAKNLYFLYCYIKTRLLQ